MGKVAFVFSGQGAQYSGMGQTLYRENPAARSVFDRLEALRPGTLELCFRGDEEALKRTDNTQPALFALELAAAAALRAEGVVPSAAAGFSLGEVCALTDAGAFSLEQGFAAVCRRGMLMQQAAEAHDAAMGAVVRLSNDTVEALCREFTALWPVNYNSPGQLVVAGDRAELNTLAVRVKQAGGRLLPLKVGGGFHSPLMADAAERLRAALPEFSPCQPQYPVYSNRTAEPYGETVIDTLAEQMCSPVRWQETLERLWAEGIRTFLEIGPGETLCGLIRKTLPEARVCAVGNPEGLRAAAALWNEGEHL